jgi:hypothetical protein
MSHQRAALSNPRAASPHAIVIVEEPAESLTATNAAGAPPWRHRVDECVAEALVISLVVVVLDKLRERPPQDQDEPLAV